MFTIPGKQMLSIDVMIIIAGEWPTNDFNVTKIHKMSLKLNNAPSSH